jgi:hypothetical protein
MKTDVIWGVTPSNILNIYLNVHIFRNLAAVSNSRHQKGEIQFLNKNPYSLGATVKYFIFTVTWTRNLCTPAFTYVMS